MNFAAWLHGLYLFTTIVGVGVTLVDLLGLLGHATDHGHADGITVGADATACVCSEAILTPA